jgi:hypothetical protein
VPSGNLNSLDGSKPNGCDRGKKYRCIQDVLAWTDQNTCSGPITKSPAAIRNGHSQDRRAYLSALVRPHKNALWISRRYPNDKDPSRGAVARFPQDVA